MISRWFRQWLPPLFSPLVKRLDRMGVTPSALTTAGLAACAATGLLAALDRLPLAALMLALSGIFDSLDGELARRASRPNRLGPFIDSVADHYGDFFIYLGIAWAALQAGDRPGVLLCLAAQFGSLAGSHIRSRAGMAGIDTMRVGFFTRMERTIVLLAGFLTGTITPAVGILAVAANLSALQRLWFTFREAGRQAG